MRDTQSAGPTAPPGQGHAAFAGLRRPRAGTLAASYAGLNTHYVADAFLSAAPPPGVRLRTTTSSVNVDARAAKGLCSPFGQPTTAKADGHHRHTHCVISGAPAKRRPPPHGQPSSRPPAESGPSQRASPEYVQEDVQAIPLLLPAHGSLPTTEGQATSCERPPAAQQAQTRETGHYDVKRASQERESDAQTTCYRSSGRQEQPLPRAVRASKQPQGRGRERDDHRRPTTHDRGPD